MSVKIYIEGGGDSKELHVRCRTGFGKLLKKAGFTGRMPAIVACGGRESAYDNFKTAAASNQDAYPMLLVDSEDRVSNPDEIPDSTAAWDHLKSRDNWDRPASVAEDQAQLMTTCMETWILADRKGLEAVFGSNLRTNALLPLDGLEARARDEIQESLKDATQDCGRERAYRKGRRSFQVLARLDPETLKVHLLHFRRLVQSLERHLPERHQR